MGELYYVNISVDSITEENAQKILDFVIELNGSKRGVSIHYSEAIN